jgi:TetR/AcrR family transcriptional regulator, mexJK operon transcriptional repressor
MRKRTDITRKVILTAARYLFLSHGYVETTIDDIAARAQVTKRTIYGYFPDKRALFKGVIEEAVGTPWEFRNLLDEVTTISGLRNALIEIATGLNDIITQPSYIQLLRVAIAEMPTQPELGTLFETGVTQRSCNATATVLRTASVRGLVSLRDTEAAAHRFVGGFLVPVFLGNLLKFESKVHKCTSSQLSNYVDDFLGRTVTSTQYEVLP